MQQAEDKHPGTGLAARRLGGMKADGAPTVLEEKYTICRIRNSGVGTWKELELRTQKDRRTEMRNGGDGANNVGGRIVAAPHTQVMYYTRREGTSNFLRRRGSARMRASTILGSAFTRDIGLCCREKGCCREFRGKEYCCTEEVTSKIRAD